MQAAKKTLLCMIACVTFATAECGSWHAHANLFTRSKTFAQHSDAVFKHRSMVCQGLCNIHMLLPVGMSRVSLHKHSTIHRVPQCVICVFSSSIYTYQIELQSMTKQISYTKLKHMLMLINSLQFVMCAQMWARLVIISAKPNTNIYV